MSHGYRPVDRGHRAAPPDPVRRASDLPTGTVTFLFTDVEGSTSAWERHPETMRPALARHDALIEQLVEQHHGRVVRSRGEGDSHFAVFARASDAVVAACAAQRAFIREQWSTPEPLRVRMALHTGEADLRAGDYYGSDVNRCARLRAIAHGGQVLLSGVTADLVRHGLPPEVGLRDLGEVRLRGLDTPERVWQLTHPDLPFEFPRLAALDSHRPNLPVQLSSFVGRERELVEVIDLLRTARLVTLTGAGGIGKTRLALQVALAAQDEYAAGVVLVELASLADPALVIQTVAAALGVYEQPQRPLIDRLADTIGRRHLLLVLDNCEHLLDACAALADGLLRACPSLRILATSRERLGIGGETAWQVPSLSVPAAKAALTPRAVAESEAARLFVERAQAAVHGFSLSEQNAESIGRLCRRLDGVALAIELAAAWVPVLSVQQIVDKLDDALRLLVTGSRVAPARQQTLRATLDWSYRLLAEPEQRLFDCLSVFAGGWTLGSAETVCSAAGTQRELVLDLLAQLVGKSLVLAEPRADGSPRYRLLEPVRQYAQERLVDHSNAHEVTRRHALHFLELAEQADVALRGADREIWLDKLEREHDNLRAALAWAQSAGDREIGLRLAGALSRFWAIGGHLREGLGWLDAARALGDGAPAARAKVLSGSGWLAMLQGDLTRARTDLQASLTLVRQLHDTPGIAETLNNLGRVALQDGDIESARACFAESLVLSRALGHRWGIAFAFTGLAQVAFDEGDNDKARALFGQAVAMYRLLDSPRHIAVTLSNLASVILKQGKTVEAQALYAEALGVVQHVEDRTGLAHVLEGFAGLAETHGRPERAQQLLEAAAGIRASGEYPVAASDHAWPEAPLSMFRDARDNLWITASAWTYDRALAEAVAELGTPVK